MKKYKYIGESDEMTTKGKIYNVKSNGIFIDDTNSECCLGSDYKKYFEIVESEGVKQKEKTYTEKNMNDAYDKGFKDGLNKQLDKMYNLNFNRGNVIKYVARAGKKDDEIKDLEKALDFIQREIKYLKEK